MELRANRAVILLSFVILIFAVSVLGIFIANALFTAPGAAVSIGVIVSLLVGLGSVIAYPRFEHWAERRLLSMPLPPIHLLETYTERITTSLDMPSLVHLLKDEILPSLLVRQSAVLHCDENRQTTVIYASGIETGELPQDCNDPGLLARAGHYRPVFSTGEVNQLFPWVRLVLPLKLGGRQIGLWLLGRRDPDDFYAQVEITILQTLANQTTIALTNILQAGRLHALYQADIERQEIERSRLTLELHDDVLGQMAMLMMNVGEGASPQFEQAYQSAVGRVREIINALRPAMLNYGLRAAIDELADEALELAKAQAAIRVSLLPGELRYPPAVELHLYRIVQQACQNALKHAQASVISIAGCLDPEQVDLTVEDNGIGFVAGEHLDLVWLLANKHFGLAGMYERAALIGARLQIDSAPQRGTRVQVSWGPK
jgi:signal transduction histidine kinase